MTEHNLERLYQGDFVRVLTKRGWYTGTVLKASAEWVDIQTDYKTTPVRTAKRALVTRISVHEATV
jgi:hypothetical protein